MTNECMYQLYLNGYTYQQIGDMADISKQAVYQHICTHKKVLEGNRGKRFNINDIIYEGIYEYFANNPKETLTSFENKIRGYDDNKTRSYSLNKIKTLITGETESSVKIKDINKICEICNKPFEETFKRRVLAQDI